MADNFLENRYEEVFGNGKKNIKKIGHGLDTLLEKNRSVRGYNKNIEVSQQILEKIVAVNTKIPSARNQQILRFKLVTKNTGAEKIIENIKLGGALPELNLPFPETEPEAFIIVCSKIEPTNYVYIDLGISLQSMLLKAVEIGFNGIIIGAFNEKNITEAFNLKYKPLAVLAIGKSIEKIELVKITENESHNYYRKNGVHYVPKLGVESLLM
ncbi:MAG: nitroreductase family protein [Bacteroidales bacterium]|nr:nitroreductase family protein [Bacteroidales bacterium]